MSLTVTEIAPVKRPVRRRCLMLAGAVLGTLVALGGWQLAVAIRNVRVTAAQMADT